MILDRLPPLRQQPPEPSECAVDDPPFGEHLKALGGVGSFDDLKMPSTKLLHRCRCRRCLMAAISEEALNERKEPPNILEHRQSALVILDIGGLDMCRRHHAERIDNDMVLLALDFLADVIPRRIDPRPLFPRLSRFDRR